MDENSKIVESLLERAVDYGKSSYELVKLKAIDKTSDGISSFLPNTVIFLVVCTVVLFINLGLAFWLGEYFGKSSFGFFIVAGFYIFIALILYLFMRKWLKRILYDFIIRQLLK